MTQKVSSTYNSNFMTRIWACVCSIKHSLPFIFVRYAHSGPYLLHYDYGYPNNACYSSLQRQEFTVHGSILMYGKEI